MMWKSCAKFCLYLCLLTLIFGCDESSLHANISRDVVTKGKEIQEPNESSDADIKKKVESSGLELKPEEYKQWIKNRDNGLVQKRIIEDIVYQMILVPEEYFFLKELNASTISKKELNRINSSKSCNVHFVLRISQSNGNLDITKVGINNQTEFDQRIRYLSFDIKNELFLESKKDKSKIQCKLSTFERDYNLAPYATFTLEFPLCEIKELSDYRLVYQDQLFNHGKIKFYWKNEILKELPKLISNE